MSKPTFVYLIAQDERSRDAKEIFKVGITSNLSARLNMLQTGSPVPLVLVKSWKYPTREDARWVERKFHDESDYCRLIGEWFCDWVPGALTELTLLSGRCWVEYRDGIVDGLETWLKQRGLSNPDIDFVFGEVA